MCGEQHHLSKIICPLPGSPPRVRGTAHIFVCPVYNGRITPACAGNSPGDTLIIDSDQDHPRVCGEQRYSLCQLRASAGSPPRVRGTAGRNPTWWAAAGITPACAGNSPPGRRCQAACWDHPRVCGEQSKMITVGFRPCGSPPRVRGTEVKALEVEAAQGITPACAGNSRTSVPA